MEIKAIIILSLLLIFCKVEAQEKIKINLLKKDKYICIGSFTNESDDTIFIPYVYHSCDSIHLYNKKYPLLQPVSTSDFSEGQYWAYETDTDKLFEMSKSIRFKTLYESGTNFYHEQLKLLPHQSHNVCILFEKKHLSILKNKKQVSFQIMYILNNKLYYQKYNNIKINRAK